MSLYELACLLSAAHVYCKLLFYQSAAAGAAAAGL